MHSFLIGKINLWLCIPLPFGRMGEKEKIPFHQVAFTDNGHYSDRNKPIDPTKTELKLKDRQITHILPAIGRLTAVTSLDLSFNRLRELPNAIGKLANLKEFWAVVNSIEDLPASFGNLTKLTDVKLSTNNLKRVPSALKQLPVLEYLTLDHNPLEEDIVFPENWKSLKVLSFEGCRQKTVSSTINHLQGLQILLMGRNYWDQLPPLEGFPELKVLVTNNMKLPFVTMPESVKNLGSIVVWDCRNSGVCRLPDWLGNLKFLMHFELGKNKITELPPSIAELKSLVLLDLNGNRLTRIPKALALLPQLQDLSLNDNPITSLPVALFEHRPRLRLVANCGVDKALAKRPPVISRHTASLAILAAQKVASQKLHLTLADLPQQCLELLWSAKECSTLHCKGIFIKGGGAEWNRPVRFWRSNVLYDSTEVLVDTHTCDVYCTNESPQNRG